jgi:drug/metabolite transporter (DMT)-like permease
MPRPRGEWAVLAALLAMTAIWGSTFFVIKDVLTRLPVTDMLAVRFALATVALVLITGRRLRMSRQTVRAGVVLGLLYGVAQVLQTLGLAHTAASVSGFLTGLYVVATPLLAALVLRVRVTPSVWAATVLATVGLGVLSLHGFSIGYGELLTVASALVYAAHITLVCTVAACWPGSGTGAGLQLPTSGRDWLVVVYLGVVAGAVTMVLQTWAQARVDPARAAVVMAMEPVWAAAFAVAFGGERLTLRMVTGGLAILTAMYLVELAPRPRSSSADAPRAEVPAPEEASP